MARIELLFRASSGASQLMHKRPEDVVEPGCLFQQSDPGELIAQQASAQLQHIKRALDHMRDACPMAYAANVRNEISYSRLRIQPQAVLCMGCIEKRLEHLSADAL